MAEKLRRRARAQLLAGLARVAGWLPTSGVRLALESASPLARFTRAERRMRANLELALGAELDAGARERIGRGVRRHGARLVSEWLRLAQQGDPRSPASAWIDELVQLDDSRAVLERQRADGRGLLIVTAHLGNWELLCARLHRLGLQGAVIGFERPNDSSHRWLEGMRRGYGVTTLPQHVRARELLRLLRRGETLGLLCDLEVRRLDGEFVPFFGRPALTMNAPAALARASGLPLIPVRCILAGQHYRMSFEEPLELDARLPRGEGERELLARLNGVYERWIRETPEQWAWHQPRWRTQPGELDPAPLSEQRRRERLRRLAAGREVVPEG